MFIDPRSRLPLVACNLEAAERLTNNAVYRARNSPLIAPGVSPSVAPPRQEPRGTGEAAAKSQAHRHVESSQTFSSLSVDVRSVIQTTDGNEVTATTKGSVPRTTTHPFSGPNSRLRSPSTPGQQERHSHWNKKNRHALSRFRSSSSSKPQVQHPSPELVCLSAEASRSASLFHERAFELDVFSSCRDLQGVMRLWQLGCLCRHRVRHFHRAKCLTSSVSMNPEPMS